MYRAAPQHGKFFGAIVGSSFVIFRLQHQLRAGTSVPDQATSLGPDAAGGAVATDMPRRRLRKCERQLPIGPPSSLVMTTQRRTRPPAGRTVGPRAVLLGVQRIVDCRSALRPGCWMPTNIVRLVRRDEHARDFADIRADQEPPRLAGRGSAHSIWLLPKPA